MADNSNLHMSRAGKTDEFYTQLSTIEDELRHYRKYFRDKIIFCNCDDPYESNFFKYFALNFNVFGLKKLITTCYETSPIVCTQLSLFDDERTLCIHKEAKRAYKIEISEVKDENGSSTVDLTDVEFLLKNNKNRIQITIKELCEGYEERGAEGIEGVVAYGGKLDVRPPYQREYVYAPKERDEVIRTVKKGFPLNIMYWAKTKDGRFELMDGQQRTISICRYAAEGERTFSVDEKYYFNLETDIQNQIDEYSLDIYICDGIPSEVHEWFKVINIAGKTLTAQELRNTSYTGTWLSDAKLHFSKPTCAAYNMGKDYVNGSPIRQEILETAIAWISARDGLSNIESYMALHQHDENANQIWIYFKRVIEWIETIFPVKRKEMKGIEWGLLYNEYKDAELDPSLLEETIKELMMDDDVTDKKGIYYYVLTNKERYLYIRAFTASQKREAYERQNGICPNCNNHFEFEAMEGDHITPWHEGGKTDAKNCQMLCKECNRRKAGK